MTSNVSQKAQKAKLFALQKQSFVEELLRARPQDYAERNWLYSLLSHIVAYPLQFISILAGGYLLFDVACYVWQLRPNTGNALAIHALCFAIFLGIETLRRWLVNTTGYHYLATFRAEGGQLTAGEWLSAKVYILVAISALLITSGTAGAYLYIKHHAPQAATLDINSAVSPIAQKISHEQEEAQRAAAEVARLQAAKARELAAAESYAVWQGQRYLLPEVKARHTAYDRQIEAAQAQRHAHQRLKTDLEQKLNKKEVQTEQKNEQIGRQNEFHKEAYAGACAGVWLVFEALLLWLLAYPWVYKYGVKREILLEQLQWISPEPAAKVTNTAALTAKAIPTAIQFPFSVNQYQNPPLVSPAAPKPAGIGFKKWYEEAPQAKETSAAAPQVIVKEVPVIREVVIEKPIEVVRTEVIEAEGFAVTCAHCGKTETKKRPAKYCSASCRNKAWKAEKIAVM